MIDDCNAMCHLMQQIVPEYNKAMARKFSTLPVTPSQVDVLFALDEHGPQKISELAQRLNMVDSNVSNICSRLEKSGYVERIRQQEDQRVVKIQLTTLAKTQMVPLRAEEARFIERINQSISASDVAEINQGLEKLNILFNKLNQTEEKSSL